MVKIFLDFLFVGVSFLIPFLIVSSYLHMLDEKEAFPYSRSVKGWINALLAYPFKTVKVLYGDESSSVKKDALGFFLFGLVLFVSYNVLYFRDEFFTMFTVYFTLGLVVVFFLIRLIFAIIGILKHKSLIQEFRVFYKLEKKHKETKQELEKTHSHLKNREKCIGKIYTKWKRFHDKMAEKQADAQERIDDQRAWLNIKLQTLASNLEKIHSLAPDTVIAVDSNVLMKADDYVIDAISRFPVLISKRVQQEWDKNKTSEHGEKAYRARQAIRRLVELPNYEFTVSKWQDRFLMEHNLLKGVPDDEIIADYLYEQMQGKNIIILSDDLNFTASAKVHMPVLSLKKIDIFS